MDPETERRLAAMIMEEASRLRNEADRVGVAAYLAKPKTRSRANPQFLQATVRSVQQSNKIVETNEMWRRRAVELENEKAQRRTSIRKDRTRMRDDHHRDSSSAPDSRRRRESDTNDLEDNGLEDEEIQQFLNSRLKRGRGAVGSRMDEPGPYLPFQDDTDERDLIRTDRYRNEWEDRIVGPQMGPSLSGDRRGDHADGESWKHSERASSVAQGRDEVQTSRIDRKKEKRKHKKGRDSRRRKETLDRSSKRKRS